ncbi:MAG: hypothetical protein QW794_00055 [Thermosphaera sp.]
MESPVERVNPILTAVNKHLLDTGLHAERMNIIAFLRAVSEDYARGELTLREVEEMVREAAENIVALAASVGKSLMVEEVEEDVRKAVLAVATRTSALLLPERFARRRLRKMRREEEGLV